MKAMKSLVFAFMVLIGACSSSYAYSIMAHRYFACKALAGLGGYPDAEAELRAHAYCNDCTIFGACSRYPLRRDPFPQYYKYLSESQSSLSATVDAVCKGADVANYSPPEQTSYKAIHIDYPGDDILMGAIEEDGGSVVDHIMGMRIPRYLTHFWDPDLDPTGAQGGLSLGLRPGKNLNDILKKLGSPLCPEADQPSCEERETALSRARSLWSHALNLYRAGNKREAYYVLGRVAHLLSDLTVPAHVHSDVHGGAIAGALIADACCGGKQHAEKDKDTLELRTKNAALLKSFDDIDVMPYHHETLLDDALWASVTDNPSDGLFRLFWFTAQKTQYWASDGDKDPSPPITVSGGRCEAPDFLKDAKQICIEYAKQSPAFYRAKDGSPGFLPADLWAAEGMPLHQPCEIRSLTANEEKVMARALATHALSAVSGLYRLFWDQTHDQDGDGYGVVTDCDDANPAMFPGNTEVCTDALDNDCDGEANENCASFAITHSPYAHDPDGDGDHDPHQLSDIRVAESSGGVSSLVTLSLEVTGGFAENVLLRVAGIAPDDSPVHMPDGPDDDLLPDDYGDGVADGPYNADFTLLFSPRFGPGAGTTTRTIPAGGSTEFKLRRLATLAPGRYMLKIEGVSAVTSLTRSAELVLVIGENTPGYTPR
ncbi:MAG: MopE-related protein [Patescibacteria group bacterium]